MAIITDPLAVIERCESAMDDVRPRRVLTMSAAESYAECPGIYDYLHNLQIRPVSYRPALAIGTAVHAGAAALFGGGSVDVALPVAEQCIERELGSVEGSLDGDELEAARTRASYDRARVRAMVTLLAESDLPRIRTTEIVLGPYAAVNPVTGGISRTFAISGRLDGLDELEWDLPDGTLEIGSELWEVKTTSEDPDQVAESLRIGLQIQLYQWLIAQSGRPRPVSTQLLTISKPTIKVLQANKKRAAPESPEEFETRALEAYREDPPKAVKITELPVDTGAITSALELVWLVAEQIRHADRHGYLRPRGRRCRKSFGWCEYKDICWYGDTSKYRKSEVDHEELEAE